MTEKPTEKLSMKRLADDIEEVRKQIAKLEKTMAQEKAMAHEKAVAHEKAMAQEKAAPQEKAKGKTAAGLRKEITADEEHALTKALANYKSTRREQTGHVGDADTDWHEAEAEMKLLLAALRSGS
mgnify:CR=1 FL=1